MSEPKPPSQAIREKLQAALEMLDEDAPPWNDLFELLMDVMSRVGAVLWRAS